MTDNTYGGGERINPGFGYVGGYLNFGLGELSFRIDQDGVRSGGFAWTAWGVVDLDADVNDWGWSIPTPLVQIGETYTLRGTCGTFSVGTPAAGLEFGVHKDNPSSGIGPGSGAVFTNRDTDGNATGYTFYHEEHSARHGWQYRIVTTDLDGNQVGDIRFEPMPVENQLQSAVRCFPADTPIAVSLTETRPISELRVGDTVLAFDPGAELGRGALVPRRVVRLYRNTTKEWVRLSWEEGGEAKELVATPGHHVLDRFGSFPTIGEMVSGGRATVVLASGELAEVTAERIVYSAETAHLFERAQVASDSGQRGSENRRL